MKIKKHSHSHHFFFISQFIVLIIMTFKEIKFVKLIAMK